MTTNSIHKQTNKIFKIKCWDIYCSIIHLTTETRSSILQNTVSTHFVNGIAWFFKTLFIKSFLWFQIKEICLEYFFAVFFSFIFCAEKKNTIVEWEYGWVFLCIRSHLREYFMLKQATWRENKRRRRKKRQNKHSYVFIFRLR